MYTEKTMKALNAARKVAGVARQGGTASPVVVRNTMLQLEREVSRDTMPHTFGVLQHLLDNRGMAGEKMAMASFDEIAAARQTVRQQLRPTADVESAAAQESEQDDGDDAPRAC